MKKLLIGCSAFTLSLAIGLTTSTAQDNGSQLERLGDEIADSVQLKNPTWRHEQVAPMKGSENVLLQQWSSESQSVRIAIVLHNSQDITRKVMRDLVRDGQVKEILVDLGDEGVAWGRGTVSFRTRNLTIDVSAVMKTPALDVTKAAANLAEERKLSKEFARLVADAIKDK